MKNEGKDWKECVQRKRERELSYDDVLVYGLKSAHRTASYFCRVFLYDLLSGEVLFLSSPSQPLCVGCLRVLLYSELVLAGVDRQKDSYRGNGMKRMDSRSCL